ncbi:protein of unknown function [Burkholderia multivorans]
MMQRLSAQDGRGAFVRRDPEIQTTTLRHRRACARCVKRKRHRPMRGDGRGAAARLTLRRLDSSFQRGLYDPGYLGCAARRRRRAAVFRRPVVSFDQRRRRARADRLAVDQDDPADRGRRGRDARRPDRPHGAGQQALTRAGAAARPARRAVPVRTALPASTWSACPRPAGCSRRDR